MKLPHRRQFLHLAAGAAALLIVSRFAWAQAYPSRPVRIIVGFAAGGAADTLARLLGQVLSERLGQPFIIENRPGAATNIATEAVVRAPPDGYTLLLVVPANAISATLYDKLNFNFIRDITPVASLLRVPFVMVVNPSFPAKTVPEFITYAKANPGKVKWASTGNATVTHVGGELFKMMAGVKMLTCRTAATHTSICSADKSTFTSAPCLLRSSTSRRVSCTDWRGPPQRAQKLCRACPRWASSCRATSRAAGTALADPPARGQRSSRSSTTRPTPP